MQSDNEEIYVIDFTEQKSSLISKLEYDALKCQITVFFRNYFVEKFTYEGVAAEIFEEFINQESPGKFYLHFIKPNFKQVKFYKMSDEKKKLPTKNIASDKKRWIDISIDVRKIKKEWLQDHPSGTFLNMKMQLLPDGTVDKYGNLAMITQTVPQKLYKDAEAKEKGSGKNIESPILGNAAEIDWDSFKGGGGAVQPGSDGSPYNSDAPVDDLPF